MKLSWLHTFMDTFDEFHAFVLGWCEAIYPFKHRIKIPNQVKRIIEGEYWYYTFGLAIGSLTWVGIIISAIMIIKAVIQMNINVIGLIGFTILNIAAWAISYGRLRQKVTDIDDVLSNGLVKKVDGIGTSMARLEGRVNTYIELTEGRN